MRALLSYVLKVTVLIGAVVWLEQMPGSLEIHWLGWQINTSITVALAAMLGVGGLGLGVSRLLRGLFAWPGNRRARRTLRAWEEAARALAAAMAGDVTAAKRLMRRSRTNDTILLKILDAQIAQTTRDDASLERSARALLDSPETRLLGLRASAALAYRRGDRDQMQRYIEQASSLAPTVDWVALSVAELAMARGDWAASEAALGPITDASPHAARRNHKRAVAALGRCAELAEAGAARASLEAAQVAVRAAPDFIPGLVAVARLHAAQGRTRKALGLIEKQWKTHAHPDLAELYRTLLADQPAAAQVKHVAQLVAKAPDRAESDLIMAAAAANAQVWGVARHHYQRATKEESCCAAAYAGLARCARAERQDKDADGFQRQAEAYREGRWICQSCTNPAPGWTVRCPHCAAVDGLIWHPGGLARATPPVSAALRLDFGSHLLPP